MAPLDRTGNFSITTTTTAAGTGGTTVGVTTNVFPAAPFNAVIWPAGELPLKTNAEVVRVESISGLTLTIKRAQEGTSARAIISGEQIAEMITARTWEQLRAMLRELPGGNTGLGEGALSGLESVAEAELTTHLTGNIAIGQNALNKLNKGKVEGAWTTTNIAIGQEALGVLDRGLFNVAIGAQTLGSMKIGTATAEEEREACAEVGKDTGTAKTTASSPTLTAVSLASWNAVVLGNEVKGTHIEAGAKITSYNETAAEIVLSKNATKTEVAEAITVEGGSGYAAGFNVVIGHLTGHQVLLGQHNTVVGSDSFGNNPQTAAGTATRNGTTTLSAVSLPGYRTIGNPPGTHEWGAVGLGIEVTGSGIPAGSVVTFYSREKKEIKLSNAVSGAGVIAITVNGRSRRSSQNTVLGSSALEQFTGRTINVIAIGISALEQLEGESKSPTAEEFFSDGDIVAIGQNAGARLRHSEGSTLIGAEAHRNGDTSEGDVAIGSSTLGAAGGTVPGEVEAHCGVTKFNVAIGSKALGAEFGGIIIKNAAMTSGATTLKFEVGRPTGASFRAVQEGQEVVHPLIEAGATITGAPTEASGVVTVTLTKKATGTFSGEVAYIKSGAEANVAIGYRTLRYNVSHYGVTAVGSEAGAEGDTKESTLLGRSAGREGHNTANTFVGQSAGLGTLGSASGFNTAVGQWALEKVSTGNRNVALGYDAGKAMKGDRSDNVLVGAKAGEEVKGGGNVMIGSGEAEHHSAGVKANEANVMIGYEAGYENEGSNSLFLGREAGKNQTGSEQLVIANTATVTNAWIRGEAGRASAPKLGFYGVAPVVRPNPGAGEAELRTALKNLGLLV